MFIVKPDFLKGKDDYVLLDSRYNMTEPDVGHTMYEEGHIKGAHYVDLDRDLVTEIGVHGGRHPLKDLDEIKVTLESLGVSNDGEVFIYDSGEMPMASVLWFVLQLLGKDAYVIEGGFDALVKSGFQVTTDIPTVKSGKLTFPKRLSMRADVNDALRSIEDDKAILIDVRGSSRYLGLEEPYDRIAGHIPEAVNVFWQNLMNSKSIKSREELERIFSVTDGYDEVIFQCGSGITGAVALIIYMSLGKKARLYSGSYSDYITYKGNKLIVKDNREIIL